MAPIAWHIAPCGSYALPSVSTDGTSAALDDTRDFIQFLNSVKMRQGSIGLMQPPWQARRYGEDGLGGERDCNRLNKMNVPHDDFLLTVILYDAILVIQYDKFQIRRIRGERMDAMVSARVPVEIKKRGDAKLKEIGSNPTELVNAAYRYVIERGSLPGDAPEDSNSHKIPQTKTLSGIAAESFIERWKSLAVLEAPEYDGENFKQLLDDARGDRFARLA